MTEQGRFGQGGGGAHLPMIMRLCNLLGTGFPDVMIDISFDRSVVEH